MTMAERRMFAKTIIDSDAFLDLPMSAQTLYFHMSMAADDDGFCNNPKKIRRMLGCGEEDLELLGKSGFVIFFANGVAAIRHWRVHNYIRKDTYNETRYQKEKASLELDETKAYREKPKTSAETGSVLPVEDEITEGTDSFEMMGENPSEPMGAGEILPWTGRGRVVDDSSTQVREGKDRIVELREEEERGEAPSPCVHGDGSHVVAEGESPPPEFDSSLCEVLPRESSSSSGEKTFEDLRNRFEGEFGRSLTPGEGKKLREWQEDAAFSPELIGHALELAVFRNKLGFRYIGTVLGSWKGEGIVSVAEAEAASRRYHGSRASPPKVFRGGRCMEDFDDDAIYEV